MSKEHTNIQFVADSYLCSACGACNVACNKNAISFKWSSLGRKYAEVEESKCIDCKRCVKVCPSTDILNTIDPKENDYIGNIIGTYTGRAQNELIFQNAQSGGVCTAIIKYLFETGEIDAAVLCRMDPGNTPNVKGVLVEKAEDISACQKSCYTPVDVLSALKSAKGKKAIAIVGLPCHIAGATKIESQIASFKNIKYKIGLICDRTLCSGIQNVFATLVPKQKFLIQWRKKDFIHRNQKYDYRNAPVVILDEKKQILPGGILPNSYRFALKDFFTSPRCRVCRDKLNTSADIVLGDPWGMSNIDWEHGESLVITRTDVGQTLIDELIGTDIISLNKRDNYDEVIQGQHIDEKIIATPKYREALYDIICNPDCEKGDVDGSTPSRSRSEFLSFIEREKNPTKKNTRLARSLIIPPKGIRYYAYYTKQITKSLINRILSR